MWRIPLLLATVVSTGASDAAGQNFVCPITISVTETVQGIPEGWRVGHDEMPPRLFYVSMAYADGYDVRDDYEKKLSGGWVKYTWDLNAVVKKEPWFVRCEYQGTNILLLIPVPATMKFCSTIQKDGFDRQIRDFMTCE